MTRTVVEVRNEITSVDRVSRWVGRSLLAVAFGALAFTTINVTVFATTEGVPWFIAWLLDPLVSVALVTVLLAEGELSRHGRKAGGWAALLKWFAIAMTWAMNVWTSLAPVHVAGLLLHSAAPGLVLLLAEAAPRVRRGFAVTLTELGAELERIEAGDQERADAPMVVTLRAELARQRDGLAAERARRETADRELRQARDDTAAAGAAAERATERARELRRAAAVRRDKSAATRRTSGAQRRLAWAMRALTENPNLRGRDVDEEFPDGPRDGARVLKRAKAELAARPEGLRLVGREA